MNGMCFFTGEEAEKWRAYIKNFYQIKLTVSTNIGDEQKQAQVDNWVQDIAMEENEMKAVRYQHLEEEWQAHSLWGASDEILWLRENTSPS